LTEFIRIKGWAKYQHYKDRNPPWIKLHRELLTSLTWALADDANRVLAVACMLLAAATDNKIPADPAYIKRVAYLNSDPDFSVLLKLEFLEVIDDKGHVVVTAITPLADASKMQAHARPEAETEAETEQSKKKNPASPEARGTLNAGQVAKAQADSRHSRSQQLLKGWYQEWAGIECPWDGGEARQLSALLKAWPKVSDAQFVLCLDNVALSDCIPKGTRPREWLGKLPKFIKGPLDQFWKAKGLGNGSGNHQSTAAKRDAANVEALVRSGMGAKVQHVHADPGAAVQDRVDDSDRKSKATFAGN
jgi:hypothetical protein